MRSTIAAQIEAMPVVWWRERAPAEKVPWPVSQRTRNELPLKTPVNALTRDGRILATLVTNDYKTTYLF